MGRELQKRKNRSSRPRVRQKPKSKKLNIKSNPVVAANWDQTQTLSQNYRRLGLSAKLNSATGGTEPKLTEDRARKGEIHNPLNILGNGAGTKGIGTTKVIRDEEGKIISVIKSRNEEQRERNPLGDPLNEPPSDNNGDENEQMAANGKNSVGEGRGIVPQLEEASRKAIKKRPRKQSEREKEWIKGLIERWGGDLPAMVKDSKRNPMQQSQSNLRRRVEAYLKREKTVGGIEDVG